MSETRSLNKQRGPQRSANFIHHPPRLHTHTPPSPQQRRACEESSGIIFCRLDPDGISLPGSPATNHYVAFLIAYGNVLGTRQTAQTRSVWKTRKHTGRQEPRQPPACLRSATAPQSLDQSAAVWDAAARCWFFGSGAADNGPACET